jgi:hypothetical protein
MSFQPQKKSYILVNADGDVLTLDEAGLEEFIRLNDVGNAAAGRYCEPSWAEALRALQVGQTYRGGGGASPEWSVERGQGSPAHQGGLRSGEVPAAPRGMKGKWPADSSKIDAEALVDMFSSDGSQLFRASYLRQEDVNRLYSLIRSGLATETRAGSEEYRLTQVGIGRRAKALASHRAPIRK